MHEFLHSRVDARLNCVWQTVCLEILDFLVVDRYHRHAGLIKLRSTLIFIKILLPQF